MFRRSSAWKTDAFTGEHTPELDRRVQEGGRVQDGKFLTHSHSGHERNHFFLSRDGKEFTDLSTVSGLDSIADSRGFVLWDYDRDGWQDIALVNANAPLLNMYRNQIGSLPVSERQPANFIALRIVGGNRTAKSSTYGPRDGYGAKISVTLSDQTLFRENRCGEGFAVQNSNTMLIGLGHHDQADAVEVRWPSGKSQTIGKVNAGSLLTVFENPDDSPNRQGFGQQPYVVDRPGSPNRAASTADSSWVLSGGLADTGDAARWKMYTTMATWCDACKREKTQLDFLRGCFSTDELVMYGVPVDKSDTPEKLQAYMSTYQPPYKLLADLSATDKTQLRNVLTTGKGASLQSSTSLPSTVITDGEGKVLQVLAGVPTVSDFGKLRDAVDDD